MIAVIPVRAETLPIGGEEAIAEADGRVLLVGDGAVEAARQMAGVATKIMAWETSGFKPAAWAAALASVLAEEAAIILPASPDGRDLAPRLAYALGRPLFAGAVRVERQEGAEKRKEDGQHRIVVTEYDRQTAREINVGNIPFVATLQPGVRGVDSATAGSPVAEVEILALEPPNSNDPELIEMLPADPATVDLSEARCIISGGLGLADAEAFRQMQEVAMALKASFAGTRAAADRGWLPNERFVGATGAQVNPDLYLALGISGAIQHISGLARPKHVIAVNLDAGCSMMALANLPIVSDARAVVQELASRLIQRPPQVEKPSSEPRARTGVVGLRKAEGPELAIEVAADG